MKRITLFCILLTGISISGCKKFLDLPPKNERAVETIEDVKSVLAGYLDGIRTKYVRPIVGSFPIMTEAQVMMFESYSDNIDFAANMSRFVNPMNYHAKELFYADNLLFNQFDAPASVWNNYYQTIGFLNALIDQTNDLKDGNQDERNRVMGEMLVNRAFYVFKLLEYFAPYSNADMGIPVYLHSGAQVVGVKMPRKKQAEVYKIILDDLNAAMNLIEKTAPRTTYNVFYNARYIQNLLAQVYWFKAESGAKETSDYENAKKYAEQAIQGVDAYLPKTTAQLNQAAQGTLLDYPAFYQTGNMYAGVAAIYGSTWDYLGFQPSGIKVTDDLVSLFTDDDVRKAAYFNGDLINSTWPDGAAYGPKYVHFYLFQPEEAMLILAEADYKLGKQDEAIATLNKFKSFRNAGNADGLTGDALLQEILNERRKEFFSNSDKRWLDLKRYKNTTITRNLRFFDKDYDITVTPGDYHYALPIPITELQENPNIVQNEGWVQITF